MPRKDGTGPMGQGKMSGIGMGFCNTSDVQETGMNVGTGQGMGQRRRAGACSSISKRCSRGFGRDM